MFILDTNALIGLLFFPDILSDNAKVTLQNEETLIVSIVSLWEIGIKQSIGKIDIDTKSSEIARACVTNGIQIIGIKPEHIDNLSMLPMIHKDPFDRLIIAQALCEDYIILTKDTIIPQYDVKTLW